ncbi:MAG: glutamyl-tRNA reductase [Nocardioidaceae bacterium]
MSVLVVGISHRSAPVDVLERIALDADDVHKLLLDVAGSEHVSECAVLATCNRVEVYAEVDRFHGSVEDLSGLLIDRAGESRDEITPHLYVHYDEGAVAHAFSVAAGLDSMVVGESQVLGQVREALRAAQDAGVVGPSLNALFQHALRVGKRAHAETDIDRAAPSMVGVAVDLVAPVLGELSGRRALIIGAGSMASLVVTTLATRGLTDVVVVNRTSERADRLAEQVDGRGYSLERIESEMRGADLVVSATAALSTIVSRDCVERAMLGRSDRRLAVVDLALPHDVERAAGAVEGVTLVDLAGLAASASSGVAPRDVEEVRRIVAAEVARFEATTRAARVTPTVVALRTMATEVVDSELERLAARLPDLDPQVRADVEQTVRRVASKLLHEPTVRVKALVGQPMGSSYADALAELFALTPGAVQAVTSAAMDAAPEQEGSG